VRFVSPAGRLASSFFEGQNVLLSAPFYRSVVRFPHSFFEANHARAAAPLWRPSLTMEYSIKFVDGVPVMDWGSAADETANGNGAQAASNSREQCAREISDAGQPDLSPAAARSGAAASTVRVVPDQPIVMSVHGFVKLKRVELKSSAAKDDQNVSDVDQDNEKKWY